MRRSRINFWLRKMSANRRYAMAAATDGDTLSALIWLAQTCGISGRVADMLPQESRSHVRLACYRIRIARRVANLLGQSKETA